MIFQAFINMTGKIITPIPFQSGLYNIKIVRIDLILANTSQHYAIILKSDRIPFKNLQYRPLLPAGSSIENPIGLIMDTKTISITQIQNTAIYSFDYAYTFNDVFLDGYIDTEFVNAGIGTSGNYNVNPPFALSGVRCLLTLDITKSDKNNIGI